MEVKGKRKPAGEKRRAMLPVGTCTEGVESENKGVVAQVRKRTAKFARHYLISYHDTWDDEWVLRNQITVVPCGEAS